MFWMVDIVLNFSRAFLSENRKAALLGYLCPVPRGARGRRRTGTVSCFKKTSEISMVEGPITFWFCLQRWMAFSMVFFRIVREARGSSSTVSW